MKAVVLVGGAGTRLRPLTLTQPKPAITLVDRPLIRHTVDWLARHGVDEVLMASGFRADDLRSALGDRIPDGPRIDYLAEPEPLGTGGPLRLAADRGLIDDTFLALNGDVLTDLDLTALMAFHRERGATATLALHPVDDPSSFGLVRRSDDGEVTGFVEKPAADEIDTDEVSAGAYVLEPEVVDLIPAGRAVSIEREVFPRLVGAGLYGLRLEGYWSDIGTPERYLQASWDILDGAIETAFERDDEEGPLIAPGVEVGAGAEVGPRAIVLAGSSIGAGATVSGSVILDNCRVGAGAEVRGAILAAGVEVGERASIAAGAVVGAGARIAPDARLGDDARVPPTEVVSA